MYLVIPWPRSAQPSGAVSIVAECLPTVMAYIRLQMGTSSDKLR